MPRMFVPTEDLAIEQVTLVGEPHRYLTRVLRFGTGDRVDLFDGRGLEVAATVVRAGSREVTLQLGQRRQQAPRSTPPVTLLQGLPRAERMDLVIQKATELGVARVVPVRANRSAVGQQGRPGRWEKIAQEAARQCGRADALILTPPVMLDEAIAQLHSGTTRLVAWEDSVGALSLGQALAAEPQGGHVMGIDILIGPEGGLTTEEIAAARAAAFQVVTLGPRILRTETAAIVALAVVQNHVGALG